MDFSAHTQSITLSPPLLFVHTIFILPVGANLLCGDWNTGLGELRRQTVILGQTPAHPIPSLHLCDLQRFLRTPHYLPALPISSISLRERWCFLQPYYHFKDFPQNQSTWPRIRAAAGGGTVLCHSECLPKLRQQEAKQYFAVIRPNMGEYSWADFKVAVGSGEAGQNRHALTTLHRRPRKTYGATFTARKL